MNINDIAKKIEKKYIFTPSTDSYVTYFKLVHCNQDRPEYHNIYYIEDEIVEIYTTTGWRKENSFAVMSQVLNFEYESMKKYEELFGKYLAPCVQEKIHDIIKSVIAKEGAKEKQLKIVYDECKKIKKAMINAIKNIQPIQRILRERYYFPPYALSLNKNDSDYIKNSPTINKSKDNSSEEDFDYFDISSEEIVSKSKKKSNVSKPVKNPMQKSKYSSSESDSSSEIPQKSKKKSNVSKPVKKPIQKSKYSSSESDSSSEIPQKSKKKSNIS